MRKRSKILAIILSVAMVGSMWSPVFAEETTDVVTEVATDGVDEEAAEPVEEAVEAEAVEEEAIIEPTAEEAPTAEEVQPDTVDEAGDTVKDVDWPAALTVATDGTASVEVVIHWKDKTEVTNETLTAKSVTPATCKQAATYTFEYDSNHKKIYTYGELADHNYVETETVTPAGHTCDGTKKVKYICSVCNTEDPDRPEKSITLSAAHTWGTKKYLIPVTAEGVHDNTSRSANGEGSGANLVTEAVEINDKSYNMVALGSDGKPQLVDATKPGYYVEAVLCTEFGTTVSGETETDWGIKGFSIVNDQNTIDSTDSIIKVPATDIEKAEVAKITTAENIAKVNTGTSTDNWVAYSANLPITDCLSDGDFSGFAEDDIELADCSKAGSYTVTFYKADGTTVIRTKSFEVAAHDITQYVVEFSSAADKAVADVEWDKNGNPTVTSLSCKKAVSYELVKICTATGHINKATKYTPKTSGLAEFNDGKSDTDTTIKGVKISGEVKTADASSTHYSDKKDVAAELSAWQKKNADATITYDALTKLAAVTAGVKAKTMTITPSTTDCTKAGTATLTYTCTVCGKALDDETETIAYAAQKEHVPGNPDTIKTVTATCTTKGSITTARKCQNAGCEYVEDEVTKDTGYKKHTNQTSTVDKTTVTGFADDTSNETKSKQYLALEGTTIIDTDQEVFAGAAKTKADISASLTKANGDVSASVYTLCTTCGGNKVTIKASDLKVTVSSITAAGAQCKPGSITLVATWSGQYNDENGDPQKISLSETKTFEYYSSALAYSGRKTHTVGETKKENEVAATETTNGSYDLVTYCSVCGSVIKTEHVTVAATGVKLPAVQNLKAETKGMNRVKLTWDKLDGAIGYIVLGLNDIGRYGNQIAYTTQTSWTDTAADSEAYNFYWVVGVSKNAENKNVVGELGSYVYAIGRVVGATTNLAAKTASNGVTLTWTKASNANGYVILSRKGSTGKANKLTSVGDVASYTDTTADGTTFYWVYGTYTNEEGKTVVAGATSNYAYATK